MSEKVIKITKSDLIDIVQDVVDNYYNPIKYKNIEFQDDLIEYNLLQPKETGLKVNIWIDSGGAYKMNEHPILSFFVDSYDINNLTDVIPIDMESLDKSVMFIPEDLNIKIEDYLNIIKFLKLNQKIITEVAEQKITLLEFYQQDKALNMLNEMPILDPKISYLPTTLWLDHGTHPQHGPRIKFKANNEQKNSKDFSTMTISDEPIIHHLPKNCSLSNKELNKIKEFVIKNKEILLALAQNNIDLRDFFNRMHRV